MQCRNVKKADTYKRLKAFFCKGAALRALAQTRRGGRLQRGAAPVCRRSGARNGFAAAAAAFLRRADAPVAEGWGGQGNCFTTREEVVSRSAASAQQGRSRPNSSRRRSACGGGGASRGGHLHCGVLRLSREACGSTASATRILRSALLFARGAGTGELRKEAAAEGGRTHRDNRRIGAGDRRDVQRDLRRPCGRR